MASHREIFGLIFALFGLSGAVHAATIYVPDDSTTIQAAIDGSMDGDSVVVRPGTYLENIDFLGKGIVVMSEQGADVTTIDGGQVGCVVTFQGGEDSTSVLNGFKVTNGHSSYGGGVYCFNSSPTIRNCLIVNNAAGMGGGGIACYWHADPAISNNTITGNSAVEESYGGGGIFCYLYSSPSISDNFITANSSDGGGSGVYAWWYSSPTITHNTITRNVGAPGGFGGGIACMDNSSSAISHNLISGNSAGGTYGGGGILCINASPSITNNTITANVAAGGGYGGGIFFSEQSDPIVENNTITGNRANTSGGGIYCYHSSDVFMTNSILWDNSAPEGKEIYIGYFEHPSTVTIDYSDVEGGTDSIFVDSLCTLNWGTGMIDADPVYSDSAYHLSPGSPCVDAGDTLVLDACLPPGLGETKSDMGGYGGSDNCWDPLEDFDFVLFPTGPVVVSAEDTLTFRSIVLNNISIPTAGDYWLSVLLPNANEILVPGIFLDHDNPYSGQIPSYFAFDLASRLYIPTVADTGTYRLIARIGIYPGTVIDEQSFEFQVQ